MPSNEETKLLSNRQELAAAELDWVTVPGYIDYDPEPEGMRKKSLRKFYENPFIPIGCCATAGVLGFGLVNMVRGNRRNSQLFMRLRILFQGFTVLAFLGGAVMAASKKKN